MQKKKKNPAFVCPVCFLLQWISSPARLISWTTAAALRGDHTLQSRGTQKGIPKPGIPTKFLAWNCSLSKAGEENSVSSLKKKKNPTNRENCSAEESTGGGEENKPKNQTPIQIISHKKELKISLLQPDSIMWSEPFWETLQGRRGREWGKEAIPMSAQKGLVTVLKNPPSFGFQQQNVLFVTMEGREFSQSVWPWHPCVQPLFSTPFSVCTF